MSLILKEEHLELSGWIDLLAMASLVGHFDRLEGRVVFDCSHLMMLELSAIEQIAKLEQRLGVGNVVMTSVQPQVRRVLQALDFEHWCIFGWIREYWTWPHLLCA